MKYLFYFIIIFCIKLQLFCQKNSSISLVSGIGGGTYYLTRISDLLYEHDFKVASKSFGNQYYYVFNLNSQLSLKKWMIEIPFYLIDLNIEYYGGAEYFKTGGIYAYYSYNTEYKGRYKDFLLGINFGYSFDIKEKIKIMLLTGLLYQKNIKWSVYSKFYEKLSENLEVQCIKNFRNWGLGIGIHSMFRMNYQVEKINYFFGSTHNVLNAFGVKLIGCYKII